MPINNDNPLNGNPYSEEGDHAAAQNHRRTVYESVKANLDTSFNNLSASIRQWSLNESDVVDSIGEALLDTMDDIDGVAQKIKIVHEETMGVIDAIAQRPLAGDNVELFAAAVRMLNRQRAQNLETIDFLNGFKYEKGLTIEHQIKLLHAQAHTKRSEFHAHLDAINDITEVMSNIMVAKSLRESYDRQRRQAINATVKKCTFWIVGGGMAVVPLTYAMIRYRFIPPFAVLGFAGFLVKLAGGQA